MKYLIFFVSLLSVIGLISGNPVIAGDEAALDKPETKSETTEAIQEEVDEKSAKNIAEKRKKILAEATAAISESRKALKALDENNTDKALKALEMAVGKLELLMVRDPELALAPLNMDVVTYDLYSKPQTIELAIEQAEDYLEDGKVQEARALISNLASEIVIQTTNIPLATYPDAIKEVVKLIDKNKIDEAKTALQNALDTLVVVADAVIPLPVVRADQMLKEAEKLAEKEDRTDEENKELSDLLEEARTQLKMAELLGYGDEEAFKSSYKQLDAIAKKTEGGKSGKGFFDKIKQTLSKLM